MVDDDPTRRAEPDDISTVRGLNAGRKLFGRYVLESELGAGGMGVVWRARDVELDEPVALKFLPEVVARDDAAVDELKDETRHARRLTHPNIVRIHQFEREGAVAAVSMELVDGVTLTRLRLAQPGKVFAVRTLAPLVAQLCAALDYAHEQAKIVHRDLKPANILITQDGVVKVTDFGIARSLLENSTRLTGKGGAASGTLPYMSPQQVRGLKPKGTDDFYSLGAMLYELLTGKPPFFRGDPYSLQVQILEKPPLPLAQQREELGVEGEAIPPAWEETILACLAKETGDRPQSAGEVAARLQLPGSGARERFQAAVPRHPAGDLPAREFTVAVDPPDAGARIWLGPAANVEVKDGKVVLTDLPDGEHELTVQAPGCQLFTTRVVVKDGRGSVEAKLVPVRGAVTVAARPGTKVTAVDGRGRETRLGAVPAGGVLEVANLLSVGRYTLKFDHAECAPVEMSGIELVIGRATQVAPVQTLLPGELRIFSVPTGAEVRVDGAVVGSTPATVKNQPCMQPLRIEVSRPGYRRMELSVTLNAKEMRTVNFGTLTAENGAVELRLANDDLRLADAKVLVDGRSAELQPAPDRDAGAAERGLENRAPQAFLLEGLEVGSRTVEVALPDCEPWRRTVEVRDQETTALVVELAPLPGTVMCETMPAGARVVINGGDQHETAFVDVQTQMESLTPLRGALPPGTYTLRFELKDHRTATRTVTVEANRTVEVLASLERLGSEAGQAWVVRDLSLEMVYVLPGAFTMGSEGGAADEKPLTQVMLTEGYWLGKTEVTQSQWEAIMGATIAQQRDKVNRKWPLRGQGGDYPVYYVSWDEAMEFCRKLSERERAAGRLPEGCEYTLPTEAQWEYACRAGTTGDYAGDLDAMAWYGSSRDGQTHPVAQKEANAWGLHDMHGNVWEWCRDFYQNQLPGGSVTDPTGPVAGAARVLRGGGWYSPARVCRSASRSQSVPGDRHGRLGFRLALAPARRGETAHAGLQPAVAGREEDERGLQHPATEAAGGRAELQPASPGTDDAERGQQPRATEGAGGSAERQPAPLGTGEGERGPKHPAADATPMPERPANKATGLASEVTAGPVTNGAPRTRWLWFALVAALGIGAMCWWLFGFYLPAQRRIEEAKAAQARIERDKQEAAVKAQREKEASVMAQREEEDAEYAGVLQRIEAVVDGSPRALVESTDPVVQTYLSVAPDRHRSEATAAWAKRKQGWEAFRLANAKGGLIIRTDPAAAEVRVGDSPPQKGPLVMIKEVKIGRYPVAVTAPGFDDFHAEAEVKEGDFCELSATLVRSTGALRIESAPAGLSFALEGEAPERLERSGRTPASLADLPTGRYRVTIQREGWPQPAVEIATVEQQKAALVSVEFPAGTLVVTSNPSGAAVVQNGKELARTPWQTEGVPGDYAFELRQKGFKTASVSGTLEARQELRLNATLEKENFPEPDQAWQNTLGMKFAPVPGANVLFCIWETREQDFQAFVTATRREWSKPEFLGGPTYPAVNVSWDDAKAFCRWLTRKERREGRLGPNQEYRLPTDAEWSVAVGLDEPRTGTPESRNQRIKGIYPWGTQWPPPRGAGNFADEAARRGRYTNWTVISGYDDHYDATAPVGSFKPNRYGLYDLSGNVWEWCEDSFDGITSSRVVRGGAFNVLRADFLLSSYRFGDVPGARHDSLGFRCVVVLAGATQG